MATLGIDPAKEAENTETTNVLGPSGAPTAPESGSQTSGGAMATQPSSMPQSAPKAPSGAKSGGASSGMFQNIKKYAAANKPQASNMAQAAVKNVGSQASNIGKDVRKQQRSFQSSLGQQQGKVQQARDFTTGVVQGITGGAQQEPQRATQIPMGQETQAPAEPAQIGPSEDDFTKFREHLIGGAQQFGDVADLNISKQQQQAKNLAQMTAGAETGEGRRALLKNTFAQQAPYTAGMQGLDDLIVSSDKDARTQLAQGTQDITSQQKQSMAEARSQAMRDLSGYERDRGSFSENLRQQLTEGSTQFTDKAEQSAEANRAERQALAEQLGITEEQAGQYIDENLDTKLDRDNRKVLTDVWKDLGGLGRHVGDMNAGDAISGNELLQANPARQEYVYKTRYHPNYGTFALSHEPKIKNPNYDPNAPKYLVKGNTLQSKGDTAASLYDKTKDVVSRNYSQDELDLLGLSQDDLKYNLYNQGYAGSQTQSGDWLSGSGTKVHTNYDKQVVNTELDRLQDMVTDKTGRDVILASLARGGMESTGDLGTKYDELLAGQDISAQSSASEDTISRYNTLQDLMQGRNIGDRSLQAGSGDVGQAQANQEAMAKMRADILKRIGQGEA